jgi:hypothetical protein
MQHSEGILVVNRNKGQRDGFFWELCIEACKVVLSVCGAAQRPERDASPRGENDGRFFQLRNAGFSVNRFNGLWDSGGVLDSSRRVCASEPAAETGCSQGPARGGAGSLIACGRAVKNSILRGIGLASSKREIEPT